MKSSSAGLVDEASGEVVLLVSDVQGFTALSERLAPDQLAPIIGSWYARTEAILDRRVIWDVLKKRQSILISLSVFFTRFTRVSSS